MRMCKSKQMTVTTGEESYLKQNKGRESSKTRPRRTWENMTIALAPWHRSTWARVVESVYPCVSHGVIGATTDRCRILGIGPQDSRLINTHCRQSREAL
ncbi:hypothetical protein IG631_07906 [Alternaria alternata]|nr:hypothetical protein IG631_07906 [Alternaria alternata]